MSTSEHNHAGRKILIRAIALFTEGENFPRDAFVKAADQLGATLPEKRNAARRIKLAFLRVRDEYEGYHEFLYELARDHGHEAILKVLAQAATINLDDKGRACDY